jgi:large subunit ribosomal protein L15
MYTTELKSWVMQVHVLMHSSQHTNILFQGREFLTSAIHITPSRASKSAIAAVERRGGSVFCKYYNALALRDCVKGRQDRISAAPTRRTDIGV